MRTRRRFLPRDRERELPSMRTRRLGLSLEPQAAEATGGRGYASVAATAMEEDVAVLICRGELPPGGRPTNVGTVLAAEAAEVENGQALIQFLHQPNDAELYVGKEMHGGQFAWKPLKASLHNIPRVDNQVIVFIQASVPSSAGVSVPLSEYTPQGILGLANAAASVETHIAEGGKFWILDTDPLGNYREPFLIWKRKAYETLETVIANWVHEDQRIFIVLGTAGTGKSFFGYHWVMRLGEQGYEQVLYKVKKQMHILNLRNGAVQGPYGEDHPVIMEMLDDKSIWLVIDGKQKGPLICLCKVLLVCSTKKSNYEEFGKNMDACKLYLSVWSKEEIEMFMDDFECHRKSYKGMKVLEKTSALAAFDYLGGVPRYVLHRIKLVEGIQRTRMAVDELGSSVDKAAQVLAGAHIKQLSDCILHIFASDDHKEIVYGFASEKLMIELGEKYLQAGYTQTVHFLKTTINCPWVGALWGKLYEPLVHRLLSKGGKFLTKQVYEDGRVGPDQYRLIPAHNFIEASSARDLAGSMVIGNYVKPISEVFPSIDAAMDEDILVQIFKREDGKHGFKAKGLELVDCVLKRPRYELWLCVPLETYPRTGWQKWKNEKNGVYGKSNPLFQKMEQYVVEVDYRKSES